MFGLALPSPLPLPSLVQRRIDAAARELLQPKGGRPVDFTRPRGEAALVAHKPSNGMASGPAPDSFAA